MKTPAKLFAAAAMTVGAISVPAWAQNTATGSENQVHSAADRASDSTNRAADKTDAALDKAADNTRDTARSAADKTRGALDDKTANAAQAPDAKGIRDTLSSTTEATIKGSFSDIVERFVDADRNRLGKAMPSKDQLKSLDDLTKQIRDDWKAKYNQSFDIEKDELVFNPSVQIMEGKFGGDNVRTAGERTSSDSKSSDAKSTDGSRSVLGNSDLQTMPDKKGPKGGVDLTDAADQDRANRTSGKNISGSSNASSNSDSVKVAGAGNERAKDDASANAAAGNANASDKSGAAATSDDRGALHRAADKTGEVAKDAVDKTEDLAKSAVDKVRGTSSDIDANHEKGRKMATVIIPASHGLPQVTVPMIHEMPDHWRIDIPDSVDAAALQANLQKHLQMVRDQKDQWPADANEAYLAVAHHILLGIFEGTPNVQPGSEAQPAGATISPSNTPATPGAAQ